MSRHAVNGAAVTALCFLCSLLAPAASAAPPQRGGAPAAMPHAAPPHFAAPAPHVAAPAPHFSAPARVAAPHISAPPRNFAARPASPHFAAPHRAFAETPRGQTPQARAQGFAGSSRHATIAHVNRELNRPGAAAPSEAARHATENAKTGLEGRIRQQPLTDPGQTANLNRQNRGATEAERTRLDQGRFAQARRSPIIKNPVFASQSPRAVGTSLSNWTFRGHFAQSAFFRDHRHLRHSGIVLGFAGLVFWPYAYDDFVDYTFAPYAYDTFWPYAFDDVYAGIYGGYAPEYYAPEDAYAYAGSPASERAYARATGETTTQANAPVGGERICSGQAQGLTDFSIQKIVDQVQPTRDQQALLDDLRAATIKAVGVLQAACPTELPSTPIGRLAAMRTRVDAMLKAVATVRPALEKFYRSLSDEQRARFNAMDQGEQQAAHAQGSAMDRLCKGQDSAQGRLPIDRIERTLHLSPAQDDALKALDDATAQAANILKAQCQPAATLTPTGRLAAMEDRLSAMSKALQTTQAALNKFYGSLSDEQKAQFDRMNVRSA
jgi:hypothetical protein